MNSTVNSSGKLPATPEHTHRRQSFWQIILPVVLVMVIFLTAAVLVVLFTVGYSPEAGLPDQQSPLAKSAGVFLMTGTCLGSILPLLVLIGSVILIGKLTNRLPGLAHRVQNAFKRTETLTQQVGDKLASPVISIAGIKAGVVHLINSLKFWKRNPEQD